MCGQSSTWRRPVCLLLTLFAVSPESRCPGELIGQILPFLPSMSYTSPHLPRGLLGILRLKGIREAILSPNPRASSVLKRSGALFLLCRC